ncbi:hypothetical protein TruAng_007518 [Truncatella angustata]|nr:hypothetical protein TruAng_007518 [Truncatella angustata]
MKRIREYIARISRIQNLSPEPTVKSKESLSTRHSSIDEDSDGILVFQKGKECPSESGIDIVFVHCLGGSRVRSWQKDGVCWPRDLLGQEFPNVGIFTWGYTLPTLNSSNIDDYLSNPMSDLLVADLTRVMGNSNRHIIFVAHGLGGAIVKEALSAAAVSQVFGKYSDSGNVYARTAGIVFLGTPHRGNQRQTMEDVIVGTTALELGRPDETGARLIKKHLEVLTSQRDEFLAISRDLLVVCVRETLPTTTSFMVPKASATYDGLNVVCDDILADHFDIARFANRQDPGYFQLVGHLSKMSQKSQIDDTEAKMIRNREILDALYFDMRNKREPGDNAVDSTCSSIIGGGDGQMPSGFHRWLQSPGPIFWISGNPGSGKTTLMKHMLYSLETRRYLEQWAGDNTLMVASVFLFDSGDQIQKSREGMLRAFLYQILSARPDFIPICFPSFMEGPWPPPLPFNTVVNLSQGFYQLFAKLAKTLRLVLFVDALDEYRSTESDEYAARESISGDSLSSDGGNSVLGSRGWIANSHVEIARLISEYACADFIKLCISSRELPIFEESFGQFPRLRVHSRTMRLISQYCADRLENVSPGLSSGQQHLCNEVAQLSNGDFLWARLAINILMEGSLKSLKSTLDALPAQLGGFDGLYMRIVQSLPSTQRREACRIFEITLRSRDPPNIVTLTLAEEGYLARKELQKLNPDLGELLVRHEKANPVSAYDVATIVENMEQRLLSCCAGLLEKTDNGQRVVFMHLTAKEFLAKSGIWDRLSVTKPSSIEIDYSLISANIRYLRYVITTRLFASRWPRFRVEPEAWLLIGSILQYASRVDDKPFDFDSYVDMLDVLDDMCNECWQQAVQGYMPPSTDREWSNEQRSRLLATSWAAFEPMDFGQSPWRHNFLALGIQANLFNYVSAKLMAFSDNDRAAEAQSLLQYAVYSEGDNRSTKGSMVSSCTPLTGSYRDFHHDLPDAEFVRLLLQCGASSRHQQAQHLWARVLLAGRRYFSKQGVSALSIRTSPAQATTQNRQRWVAIVTALLEDGANPHLQVETGGETGGDGSTEVRSAIEIIRSTLAGEDGFARALIVIEAAAVEAELAKKVG